MDLQISLDTIFNVLGILFAVVIVLARIKPGSDDYFRKGTLILAEIDDLIDAILLLFPHNKALNTIDDLLEMLLSELKQAGYYLDEEDKKRLETRLKARLKREGIELKETTQAGQYQIVFKN